MRIKLLGAACAAALVCLAAPAAAQSDSHYTPGPLWYMSAVHVEDGQFENYMDWLSNQFRKEHEFGIKEGVELSYHVLAVNQKRAGDPDLYLVFTSKDYMTTAQQLAYEKKLNAMMNEDRRVSEANAAKRGPMRKIISTMELQELVLK